MRHRFALLGLTLLLTLPGASGAQPQPAQPTERGPQIPFQLTADEIEYERDRELYLARGHVHIIQTDPARTLDADFVMFSNRTQQGVASGDVVLREGQDTLFAEFLEFEVDSSRGVVYRGVLDSGERGFRTEGRELRKTGPETYEIEEGVFTTCRCPEEGREPWEIRAESADLEVGGYATVRNSTFRVLGVPVLWLPWMRYPIKTERESGFLFPELNQSSRSGLDVGVPFFWAVAPNVNVILTPSYLTNRGFKPKAKVEYVFGERSGGELYASFIQDQDVDPDDPETPFDASRWAVDWKHDQFLPFGWRFKADLNLTSDNEWPFDFTDALEEFRRDRFMESTASLENHFGPLDRYGVVAAAWYADDLQSPDDVDRDHFLLQRWPDVQFAALPTPLLAGLVGSFDVRFTNYQSFDAAKDEFPSAFNVDDVFFDTGIDALPDAEERNRRGKLVPGASQDNFPGPEGDGRFQEGEPLADRGQRLLARPRLSLPLRLWDVLEVEPEVGLHQTFYETDEQSFENRTLVTGRLDARTRLRRSFELPFGIGEAVHVLEPRFGWAIVSHTSQRKQPLFVPRTATPQDRIRQFELDNVTLDPADRLESFHGVTLGLGNRFYGIGLKRVGEEGDAGYDPDAPPAERLPRLLAEVSLSLGAQFSPKSLRSLFLEGVGYPGGGFSTRFNLGYDLDNTQLSEGLVELRWASDAGHNLRLTYRYLRDIPRFFEDFRSNRDRFEDFEEDFNRVNQIAVGGRWAVTPRWALTYSTAYSFEQSLVLQNRAGVEYISACACWAVRFEAQDTRNRGVQFNLSYTLLGLGDDRIRPFGPG